MNTIQKQELMRLIGSLRTAEYMSGFACGLQMHETTIEQSQKAKEIVSEIIELICL